jgi:hypothetical protein
MATEGVGASSGSKKITDPAYRYNSSVKAVVTQRGRKRLWSQQHHECMDNVSMRAVLILCRSRRRSVRNLHAL